MDVDVVFDDSEDADEINFSGMTGNLVQLVSHEASGSQSSQSEDALEAVLIPEGVRPANTDELVGMLKHAGTELTVKYLTGKLSFEQFTKELQEKAGSSSQPYKLPISKTRACPSKEPPAVRMSEVPNFELLFNNVASDDDDDDDGCSETTANEEEVSGDEQLEFSDDLRDDDWMPEDGKKRLKGDPRKRKSGAEALGAPGRKRKSGHRRKPSDLPKHLVRSQGTAMLLRAQGNTEQAIMLLYDIISKAPRAAAPYLALGSIHEEKGDLKQALKFFLVAANLQRPPPKEWFELIDMCMKLEEPILANTCYSRAMKSVRKKEEKYEIQLHKAAWYEYQEEPVKALQCQEQALSYMNPEEPEKMLSFARDLMQEFMNRKDIQSAIDILLFIHKELPRSIAAEDIHLLVELLMTQQSFNKSIEPLHKSIEILVRHCGVTMVFSGKTPAPEEIASLLSKSSAHHLERVEVPVMMPIDLKSKLVQCLILLKCLPDLDPLKEVIECLKAEDVEQCGDVHFDIAEVMVECGHHETARPILQKLITSESFSKAEVWLTYAHCMNALGNIQAAANGYYKVIQLAPNHHPARVTLSSLQQQMGHHDMALEVLTKGPSGEDPATTDQLLLLHKCELLHSQGRIEDFIAAGRRLMSYNMRGEYSPDFIKILLAIKRMKSRKKFYPHLTGKKDDVPDEISELEKEERLKFKQDMWTVYLKLVRALHEKGDDVVCLNTSILGITCPAFCEDEEKVKAAEFLCFKVGRINQSVYNLARNLVGDEKNSNQAWNLFSYVVTKSKEFHDLRFAMRGLMKAPKSVPLGSLNGNSRMISGSYKLALGEFLAVFKQSPNDLSVLCCALCLLHITSQKYTARKNLLIPQVFCLMNVYKEMRGECQETYYNIARALYQINLHYAAIHYYKKALKFPPVLSDEQGKFDLSKEISFNLAQIYKNCKNYEAARYYIEKYCVI